MLRQTANWVSSPLGINLLISLYNKNNSKSLNKFLQINSILKHKDGITIKNKIYHHQHYNVVEGIDLSEYSLDTETIDFSDVKKSTEVINNGVKQNGHFNECHHINKNVSSETIAVYLNLSVFKGTFQGFDTVMMKVYNSFNYTQDIKYEGRLLEFPMKDDFKLVIIVPNETDVLNSLYEKLIDDGFKAAVNSIRPLFTTVTEVKSPRIEIISDSQMKLNKKIVENNNVKATQWGTAKIDENGANIQVLTCLMASKNETPIINNEDSKAEKPFYFAVIFKDTALFTGQYIQQ